MWPVDHAGERGSVTAEFATVLPAALLVLALGIGAVQAGGQQLRLVDAAAVDARLIGRGDAPRGVGGASGGALDAHRTVAREGGMVCVTMTARSAVVGLGAAGLEVSGRACALDEETATTAGATVGKTAGDVRGRHEWAT